MSPASLVSVLLAATLFANGQDVIHYKFDEGGGNRVVNFATGSPAVPREGTVVTSGAMAASQAWTTGRFGGGFLQSANTSLGGAEVDTGWNDEVPADVTVAAFVRFPNGPTSAVIANRWASTNAYTGISIQLTGTGPLAGHTQLRWRSGSSTQVFNSSGTFFPPNTTSWVHIAVVVSQTAQTPYVRWYLNGIAESPQPTAGLAPIPPSYYLTSTNPYTFGTFAVGNDGASGSTVVPVVLDEFRVSLRVVPDAEILQWATSPSAAHAAFGAPCHPFGLRVLLDGTAGGLPTIGNANYQLTVYGLPQSQVTLGIGTSVQTFAGMALPFDLGVLGPPLAGCLLRMSPDVLLNGSIPATGSIAFPTIIPAAPALMGTTAYAQALLFNGVVNSSSVTNAWALTIGP